MAKPPGRVVDFFDEDDEPQSEEPEARPRTRRRGSGGSGRGESVSGGDSGGGRVSREQIRTRQLTFIGASIVVLILLVLAVRGCLDARKERSFKNYVSDLSAITVESDQVSEELFNALEGGGQGGDVSLDQTVNGARSTMTQLAERASGLDAPDEVAGAQTEIALSFDMRADALTVIAEQLPTALGDKGSNKAAKQIQRQVGVLYASDVVYDRGRFQIEQALANEEIVVDEGVPESRFLPGGSNNALPDLNGAAGLFAGASGGSGGGGGPNCDPGDDLVHGLGIPVGGVTALPSEVALAADTANTLGADNTEISVLVQNQGEADESEVNVTIEGDFTGKQTIPQIAAASEETVTIPLSPTPKSGDSGSITVTAEAVCGEQEETNNSFSFDLTFE